MKVNDPNVPGLSSTQVGGTHATESTGERQKKIEQANKAAGDQVSLSSLSAKIRELDTESPERVAYLERLRADVEAGRYHLDPREVSQKIVSEALKEPPRESK